MKLAITVTILGSLLYGLVACNFKRSDEHKLEEQTAVQALKDSCRLSQSDGRSLFTRYSCSSCHLLSSGHITDSTYLSNFGKKKTLNLAELSKLDSLHIQRYLIPSKHQGLFDKSAPFDSASNCDVQNLIFYIRHAYDIQY